MMSNDIMVKIKSSTLQIRKTGCITIVNDLQ